MRYDSFAEDLIGSGDGEVTMDIGVPVPVQTDHSEGGPGDDEMW